MKILFVSAVLPYPLHSGGQVRIYNLLRTLSSKHEITLVSFIRTDQEANQASRLDFLHHIVTVMRGRAWQARYIARSMIGRYPFLLETYNNAVMRSKISGLIREGFDVVHLEPGYVWPSIPKTSLPIVVSEHNIEHEVYEKYAHRVGIPPVRWFLGRDISRMKQWEERIWKEAAAVTAVSEDDRRFIQNAADRKDVSVVPNGVDTDWFGFAPKKTLSAQSPEFLYVGTFAWMQNRDAVSHILDDIWPLLLKAYPAAKLRIVGKSPPKNLLARGGGSISFIGDVTDIRHEYARADILLAPIRVGGGTRYKILESMAVGLPVITTPMGSAGLDLSRKTPELWVCQSTEAIVRSVHDIFRSKTRMHRLVAARRLIEKKYSWDTISAALSRVWEEAYEGRH